MEEAPAPYEQPCIWPNKRAKQQQRRPQGTGVWGSKQWHAEIHKFPCAPLRWQDRSLGLGQRGHYVCVRSLQSKTSSQEPRQDPLFLSSPSFSTASKNPGSILQPIILSLPSPVLQQEATGNSTTLARNRAQRLKSKMCLKVDNLNWGESI